MFTLVTVLAITLGTGAVTTVFSAMNALVLRPIPGTREGDRLVSLQVARRDGSVEMAGTHALYERLRDREYAWHVRAGDVAPGPNACALLAPTLLA